MSCTNIIPESIQYHVHEPEMFHFTIGLPEGVCNIVYGLGPRAGEALVTHPKVPILSFTGGTVTGVHIAEKAAPYCKRLSLEVSILNIMIK